MLDFGFRDKGNAFWFYLSLVVGGLFTCIQYRKDPPSLSAGITATLIGAVMLLLPPLLRGGRQLLRFAAVTGSIVSLVALITAESQRVRPAIIIGLALGALMLLFVHILASQALWDKLKAAKTNPATAPKGLLDHKADFDRALNENTNILNEITGITKEGTAATRAGTARLESILRRPPSAKRLRKELAESRRQARAMDKTTRRLAAKTPKYQLSAETYTQAELAYWKGHTEKYGLDPHEARARVDLLKGLLESVRQGLAAHVEARTETTRSLGVSQVLNEAVERRLGVMDRRIAIDAAQQATLQEVVALLEPFTRKP